MCVQRSLTFPFSSKERSTERDVFLFPNMGGRGRVDILGTRMLNSIFSILNDGSKITGTDLFV